MLRIVFKTFAQSLPNSSRLSVGFLTNLMKLGSIVLTDNSLSMVRI